MTFSLAKIFFLVAIFIVMLLLPSLLAGWEGLALIKNITLSFILLFFLLTITRWAALVFRWYILLKNSKHSQRRLSLLPVVLAIDFMGENSPASSASLATSLLLFKQRNVPSFITLAYGSLIFLHDLAAIGTIIAIALLAVIGRDITFINIGFIALALIALVALFLILFFYHIDKLTLLLTKLPFPKQCLYEQRKKVLHWWLRLSKHLKEALDTQPSTMFALYLLSLAHWGTRFLLLYIALIAVGADTSLPVAALIQFISGMAGFFSLLPGGFPSADISVTVLLKTYIDIKHILPALVLWRLTTYHVNFVAGSISLLWLTYKKNDSKN